MYWRHHQRPIRRALLAELTISFAPGVVGRFGSILCVVACYETTSRVVADPGAFGTVASTATECPAILEVAGRQVQPPYGAAQQAEQPVGQQQWSDNRARSGFRLRMAIAASATLAS